MKFFNHGAMNDSSSSTIYNIGESECRRRECISIVAFVLTVLAFVAFRIAAVERLWFLLLFAPAWIAVLGLLQAREKT